MLKEDKINIVFKKSVLKSILQILLMEYQGFRNYKIIKNINQLFSNLNLEKYKYNHDLLTYIWCIKFASAQWIKGILNPDLILEAARRDSEFNETKESIMNFALTTKDSLNPEEVNLIFNLVNDGVQYGQIVSKKDDFIEQLENIDLNEAGGYRKTVSALFDISQSLLNIKYNTNLLANTTHVFNSSDSDSIKESISQTFESLEASRNIFKTFSIFGKLPYLVELNLNYNLFTEIFQKKSKLIDGQGIFGLPNLESLEFAGNQLVNLNGIQFFKKLKILVLRENNLSKIDSINHMEFLTFLDVSFNKLRTCDRTTIGNLPSLQVFLCDNNYLKNINGFEKFYSIQSISFENNKIPDYNSLEKLPKHSLIEIKNFFQNYKLLQNIKVEVFDYHNKEEAMKMIEDGIKRYKEKNN